MPLRISREADALRWARGRAVIAALGGASFLASPAAYAVDSDLDGVPEYGFLTRSAVSVSLDQVDRIDVLDMDGDNDLDLLVANETTISWLENSDGAGNFGAEHAITGPGENQQLADLVDLDGDGDLDILTNAIGIYPNNGLGGFGAFQLIVTPPYSDGRALGSDLDGDGDAARPQLAAVHGAEPALGQLAALGEAVGRGPQLRQREVTWPAAATRWRRVRAGDE